MADRQTHRRRKRQTQCRIKVGAIDAAALGPNSRNRPTTTDEKKRKKIISLLAVISPVGTISGKSLKLLPPDVTF